MRSSNSNRLHSSKRETVQAAVSGASGKTGSKAVEALGEKKGRFMYADGSAPQALSSADAVYLLAPFGCVGGWRSGTLIRDITTATPS